jgi:hypothetical protein
MTEVRIRTTRGSIELSYQPDDKKQLLKAHRVWRTEALEKPPSLLAATTHRVR